LKKLEGFIKQNFQLKVCYEAGHLGFSLQRDLQKSGITCEVIASNSIPKCPGDKVKTDKLDSKKLGVLYMKGMLTPIHVPSVEDEADSDFVRSREFLMQQLKSLRNHILSTCRRMNINFKDDTSLKCHWTSTHKEWIRRIISQLKVESAKKNLSSLLLTMNQLEDSIKSYNMEIDLLAEKEKYQKRIKALICYKGIKTLAKPTFFFKKIYSNISRARIKPATLS